MAVNHEIKPQLAKLLATEDLVVEHKHVETAQFNVHTRVLILPMWEKASNFVYDMLVGHEVGHALYTPDRNWLKEYDIPPQFVNIVEDARIEKMMKRRYSGLSKTFYRGYQELSDQDFFQIAEEDVNSMNLADRANLYFKIGNFVDISFDDKEQHIISMIDECETFDDVLIAAEKLYKYCKEEKSKTDQHQKQEQEGQQGQSDEVEDNSSQSSENPESEYQSGEDSNIDRDVIDDEKEDEVDVKTADSLEESLKDLVNSSAQENIYLELPKVDLEKIIISNSEIHDGGKKFWKNYVEESQLSVEELFQYPDNDFAKFKISARKEVNYLVKEFECKKAADSYARATTSRTGVLDCSKLHTYKYNEDLFKKVTTLADGKNHGLVFVLDWSGSMCDVMSDTIKQLFNLVWFCKKVSIPFEVYAFTNEYPKEINDKGFIDSSYEKKGGLVHVGEHFSLMNILTSKVNGKVLEQQMKHIYRIAHSFSRCGYGPVPYGMSLSGTPLNESMIALHQILPNFKKEHKLQKVQCVVLSDGEGYDIKRHVVVQRPWEDEPYIGVAPIGHRCFLRDRSIGNTYSLSCQWYQYTDILLRNLKDKFPDVNFIGIRVLESRDANSFMRRYCEHEEVQNLQSSWKKERAFSIKTSAYDIYFGISSNSLSKQSDFKVCDDATKTQIKSAFVKSLRVKKMNKKILGEFVELVA